MSRGKYYAACAFGTESAVKYEVEKCGGEDISVSDGRVYFSADAETLARICVSSRCADRIYRVLTEFCAVTFEELFEGVSAVDFGDIIPREAAMPLSGDAVRSVLGSVSDVQSVAKKAVIKSMQRHYGSVEFPETKKPFRLYVTIVKDNVTVALNMVGAGMSRRGYRTKNAAAPIKETLAASLINIARWYSHPFYEPMCGSGTIAIEAAMAAKNIMPGAKRHFDAVHFNMDLKRAFDREKQRAFDCVKKTDVPVFASDVSEEMLDLTRYHAARAEVDDVIRVSKAAVRDFKLKTQTGVIVTNPPYAMRLGDKKETEDTYRQMGRTFLASPEAKAFIICADECFENKFGRKADKKRKLMNAGIKTYFYQYFRKR